MTPPRARVLVVDDQVLFRESLVTLLNCQPDFTVVAQAGSVAEAVAAARRATPDLILMDVSLPDGTGLDAGRAILTFAPGVPIVFLTVHEDDERLFAAIRAGGQGYMLKNVGVEKLLGYLRGLKRGEPALPPEMTRRVMAEFARMPARPDDCAGLDQLTERERDVLKELSPEVSNSEIAARLCISESTVKNHLRSIFAKLGLSSRREAADFVRRNRIEPAGNQLGQPR